MILFLVEYEYILYYLIISVILVIIIIKVATFLGSTTADEEKRSAYECGFHPFSNARVKFDVAFVLIALLFLVFDIEIIFLIPWVITYEQSGFLSYCSVLFFIIILFLGFIVEWFRGALDFDRDLL
jgi:NADH-quinone oxidoreductase subunit A